MVKRRARSKSGKRPSQPPAFSLSRRAALFLVVGLALLAYANTLSNGFAFDDVTLIEQNPQVTELRWGEMLGRSGYRPFRTFTYALNYWLGGLDPFGYHLVNLLLHGANAALVYLLLSKLSRSRRAAFAGALLFALHPVQTAAVAYVSGRKDLLAAFFVLLGFLAYLSYRSSRGKIHLGASLGCFGLAVLSKEVAVVFPALLLLAEAHLRERARRAEGRPRRGLGGALWGSLRAMPWLYGGFGVVAALAVFYALRVVGASRMEGYWGGDPLSNLGTSFKLFVHYLRMVAVPYPLIADYTGDVFAVSKGLGEPATWLSALAAAAFVGLAVWAFRRDSRVTLGMLWFLTALSPVLQLVPFHELAADHFLYLPLVGPCLLAGLGFQKVASQRRWSVPAWIGLAALALAALATTVSRNRDWAGDETLWEATYRQAPGSYRANLNLGSYLYRRGEWDEAIRLTKRAIQLKPEETLGYSNLGSFYRERGSQEIQLGRLDVAERFEAMARARFQQALRLNPNDVFSLSNLGDVAKDEALIAEKRGNPAQALASRKAAIARYESALALAQDHPIHDYLWFKIGMVFVDHKAYEMALRCLRKVVDRKTDFDLLQYWTAFCAFQTADYEDSARYFERTLELTQNPEAYSLLAASYERLGRIEDAKEAYRRALRQFPETVEFHHNLGVLLYRSGEPAEAGVEFRRALELQPDGPLAPRILEMLAKIGPGS